MLLGRLRIRAKLALLVITPLLSMVGLAVPVVVERVNQASRAAETAETVRVAGRVGSLVQELQQERLLSIGYLMNLTDRSTLIQQSATVSDKIADLRADLGDKLTARVSGAVAGVQQLAELRTAVLNRRATPEQVLGKFGPVHVALIDALQLSYEVDTATPQGRQVVALDAVLRTDEGISAGASIIVLVVATRNQGAITAYISNMAALQVSTSQFSAFATPEQNALYRLVEDAVANRTSPEFLTTFAQDPEGTIAGFSMARLFPAVSSLITLGQFVEKRIVTDVIAQVTAEQRAALTTAYWVGGLVLFILLVVVLLSLAVARTVARPLIRLTQSADRVARVAEGELVRIADDESESVTPIRLDPVDIRAKDEVGDLARAFDRVQGTAARLVERQAASRRNVAQMFGHVGRRTQNLVGRQIALIDRLEHQETDPTRLQHLYRLDHVSSRLRRSASSLVVLSGSAGADGHVAPMPLGDVVRLALGEIEDYTRVDVGVRIDVGVAPAVIGDLVLTLAELMENATAFSPPHTRVTVSGETVEGGVRLTLVDHGIGMNAERLAEENARLTRRERLDLAPTEVLGLFVVGRLARRHGWRVTLSATSGGGVTVKLDIAERLLVARRTEPSPVAIARVSVPPASLSWPAGPPAAEPPSAPAAPLPSRLPSTPVPADLVGVTELNATPVAAPLPPLAPTALAGPGTGTEDPGVAGTGPRPEPVEPAGATIAFAPAAPTVAGMATEPVFDAALLHRASQSLAAGEPWNAFAEAPGDGPDGPTSAVEDPGGTAGPAPTTGAPGSDDASAARAMGLRQRVPGAQLPVKPGAAANGRGPGRNSGPQPADPSVVRALIEEFEAGVRRAHRQQPATAATTGATPRGTAPEVAPIGAGPVQLTRRVPGSNLDVSGPTPRWDRPRSFAARVDDPEAVRDLVTQFEAGVARALSEVRPDHRHEEETPR
ncbi:signal transduction histidine kinase [Micromonospora pisi]|uniref:histidine kinase n=1 Tax=Micromonospora pisi TaxID=589240 RepID=A0A495JIW4_9ACTN|nr:nitrate- and nitrite sensing domain-containing protein [Micromonospora pisi]RKR88867.1 signal transduction histidine kinase [Micromonospora pisi]